MARHPAHAFTALVAAGLLAFGAAACGDDEGGGNAGQAGSAQQGEQTQTPAGSPVEAPTEIVGGYTTLRLGERVQDVLGVAGVEIGPAGAAQRAGSALRIPIRRGEVDIDTPSGELVHRGGLRFSAAGADVEATNLVLDAESGEVTAEVAGERVPLMTVDLGEPRVPQEGDVFVLTGSAGLAEEAATMVNDRLGVDVLRDGIQLGNVTVNARHR